MTTTTNLAGRARCRYRCCRRFLSGNRGRGPRAEFCNHTCRRRERTQRDRETLTDAVVSDTQPATRPSRRKYRAGDRFGSLELVEYVASGKGGSNALWECDCGNSKVIRVANVTQGKVTHCSDWTQHRHHMDPGETLSANAWHRKLSRHLGGAGTLPCALCGAVSDSNEWAYRHSSYEARCQLEGKDRGQVYSLDEGDYWVLCRSHHRRWDSGHSRTVAKGSLSLPHIALSMAYNPDYGQEALHG